MRAPRPANGASPSSTNAAARPNLGRAERDIERGIGLGLAHARENPGYCQPRDRERGGADAQIVPRPWAAAARRAPGERVAADLQRGGHVHRAVE